MKSIAIEFYENSRDHSEGDSGFKGSEKLVTERYRFQANSIFQDYSEGTADSKLVKSGMKPL